MSSPRFRLSEKVDLFERCVYLDSLLVIQANQEETITYLDCEPGLAAAGKMVNLFWKDAIDWNETLRIGNRYYNRLVKSLENPDLVQRREDATTLRQELKTLAENAVGIRGKDDAANDFAAIESKSEFLAAIIAESMLSDMEQCLLFEERVNQRFANVEMALALAANRQDSSEE